MKLALAERARLLERSDAAKATAARQGCKSVLEAFEFSARQSHAVVNVYAAFAHQLLTRHDALYAAYESLVAGRARRSAAVEDDRDRRAVGAKLYGQGATEIVYAALSLDGRGLTSYGPVSLQLRDVAIEDRATVLDENSYRFAGRPGVSLLGPLPRGHLSVWYDREELIIAKLAPLLARDMTAGDFVRLVMRSEGNRQTDEFLEVHIWGGFDRKALDSVHVDVLDEHYLQLEDREAAEHLLALARDKAVRQGIHWAR